MLDLLESEPDRALPALGTRVALARKRKKCTFLLDLLENEPDRALSALARSRLEQREQKMSKNHEIQNFSKSWTFWTLRKFRDWSDFFRIFRDPVKTVSYVEGRVPQFEQMLQFSYLVTSASDTSAARVTRE